MKTLKRITYCYKHTIENEKYDKRKTTPIHSPLSSLGTHNFNPNKMYNENHKCKYTNTPFMNVHMCKNAYILTRFMDYFI